MPLNANIHKYEIIQPKSREREKKGSKANAGESQVNAGV